MIASSPLLGGCCGAAEDHPFHGPYHKEEDVLPITDDDRLFERLGREINQAGLSWLTILKKQGRALVTPPWPQTTSGGS